MSSSCRGAHENYWQERIDLPRRPVAYCNASPTIRDKTLISQGGHPITQLLTGIVAVLVLFVGSTMAQDPPTLVGQTNAHNAENGEIANCAAGSARISAQTIDNTSKASVKRKLMRTPLISSPLLDTGKKKGAE